jgi:excisionase family DNA binding protein
MDATGKKHPTGDACPTGPRLLALSVDQAAEFTGISRSTLYEQMRAGRLKYCKIGARRVILADDLREWLVSLRVS